MAGHEVRHVHPLGRLLLLRRLVQGPEAGSRLPRADKGVGPPADLGSANPTAGNSPRRVPGHRPDLRGPQLRRNRVVSAGQGQRHEDAAHHLQAPRRLRHVEYGYDRLQLHEAVTHAPRPDPRAVAGLQEGRHQVRPLLLQHRLGEAAREPVDERQHPGRRWLHGVHPCSAQGTPRRQVRRNHRALVRHGQAEPSAVRPAAYMGPRAPAEHHDQLPRGQRPRGLRGRLGQRDAVRADPGPLGIGRVDLPQDLGLRQLGRRCTQVQGHRLPGLLRGRLGPHDRRRQHDGVA